MEFSPVSKMNEPLNALKPAPRRAPPRRAACGAERHVNSVTSGWIRDSFSRMPILPRKPRIGLTTRGLTVLSVLLWLRLALILAGAEAASERPPVLTRAEQVRGLAPAEARLGYRIRLAGVVTFSDPGKGLLFVQDASGGVFVSPQAQAWDWPVGQQVEVTGVAGPGSHMPYVNQAVLRDLGPGTPPPARRVTFARLAANGEDGNWVEIRGVVRTATLRKGEPILEIAAEGKRVRALFREAPASGDDLGALVDAEVRLQGVPGMVDKDPDSRFFLDLHATGFTNLAVEVKAPAQALLAPVQPIAPLPPLPAPAFLHRVRVKGNVSRTPDGNWRLSDATGAIRIHSTQPLIVATNSPVEVLGFPGGTPTAPVLEDATLFLPAWPQDTGSRTQADPPLLLPVLTQAEIVRNLPVSEAQRGYPVRIQGVITYADPDWNLLFVQDDTSGIYIADPAHTFAGKAGQAVAVEGYSGAGSYAPILREPRFQVLGSERPPPAKPVTLEQLKTGREDGQRVEVQGVARYVAVENGHLAVTISASGGLVKVFLPDFDTHRLPAHLVDAEVQGRGVCDTVVNRERQWLGFRLFTAELADLRVTKPAPVDPFALPVQPVNQLFQFRSQTDLRHRVHVRGQVTFRDPQWCTLFVEEEKSGLYVRTLTPPDMAVGDPVEVVGFVSLESYGMVMSEALARRSGPGSPPPPSSVTITQALSGEFQSRLITLEARLVSRMEGTAGRGLSLQGAEWSFTALLESSQSAQRLNSIREGSLLRLTGVCRLEGDDSQTAKALRLQLRTPDDVVVLRQPSRWTARHGMMAAGLAGLFLAAAVGWVMLLRRNVREQTEVIRRDVADLKQADAELRRLNRALRTLSGCNQTLVHATNETELLEKVCRIMTDHGGYRMVWVGYAEQDPERTVRPVAHAGLEAGYLRVSKITWSDTEHGRGPTGMAIRSRQPVIARNLAANPASAPWSQAAIERGYAASAALPLVRDDRVLGALTLYAAEPDTFDASEVALLTELASDLAFGITTLRAAAERERAEKAVAESERKYRELVEDANSIILRWNSEGYITFLNEFGLRFFGYAAEDIFGRPLVGTIVPPTESDGRDLRRLIEQISEDPRAFEQNVNENMRRNGERVWLAWTNRVVRDKQGQVVEILSVGTDITARKHAEEALRRSEEQFRLIMENLADLVALLDPEGRRLYNSPSYHSLLGDPEKMRGSPSFDQVHPEDKPTVQRAFEETVRTGVGQRLDYRLIDQNGRTRHIESQGSVIRDARGRVAQVLVVSRDVTERRRAEAAIHDLNTSLERRVAERTAELAVARDRAEAADRLKSAFLATMSHELRTPLNSIIGFTGILLQGMAGPLNPEQHKQLGMVRNSARHLLELINDVLDISKIEAGQLEVAREPFDLRASIEKVVGIIKPLADKHGLALRVELPPAIGPVTSDPRRVEQVLLNLLNNAIKFTERGEVVLRAMPEHPIRNHQNGATSEGETLPSAASAWRLSVTDTGIGIKPEDLATLFQPFRQVDSGLARQREGTGLGLAICRRLAELMGGEIRAESEWGKGSTFTFTLPVGESGKG